MRMWWEDVKGSAKVVGGCERKCEVVGGGDRKFKGGGKK